MMECAVLDCHRPIRRRQWCSTHYQRWCKYGDPTKLIRRMPGTGTITKAGYHYSQKNGTAKMVHVEIAEKILGRPLPPGAVIHHADENRLNNDPSNLVICPSRPYHHLLHQRLLAFYACGNPWWRKCVYCKKYDDTHNMILRGNGAYDHKGCRVLRTIREKEAKARRSDMRVVR